MPTLKYYHALYSQVQERSEYDFMYKRAEGYDNKLHRDDREHANARGLDLYAEVFAIID